MNKPTNWAGGKSALFTSLLLTSGTLAAWGENISRWNMELHTYRHGQRIVGLLLFRTFTRDKSGLKLGLAKMVLCSPHLKSDWQKEGSGWTLASRLPPKHCIAEPALSAPPTPSPNIHHLHPHASQGQDGKVQLSPHHHCCHIGERLNKNFARVWICSDITIVYRL